LQKVQGYDYWNPTLWEFAFLDSLEMTFFIKSISLSFIQLQAETYNTGHKYITEYTPEEEFTIEFLETNDFKVMVYLNDWLDNIFDKRKRVFRNGDHTKTGQLRLEKFVANSPFVNALNVRAEYETVKSFGFKNMLLLGIDSIDLNYTEGEGKVITARFTADSIDEEVPLPLLGVF
jgi:hypothetical protein